MHKTFIVAAIAAVSSFSAPALAQDQFSTSFRGLRGEAQVGLDRFHSEGDHDHSLGYGGIIGWDGLVGDRVVIGAEGSFWRGTGQNFTPGVLGGTVARKSFEEYGVAARAGYVLTPQLMVYGKAGYVTNEQRKRFSGDPAGGQPFYDHYNTTGYQVGGGAEYSLNDLFYLSAEYKYSNYGSNSARQKVSLGAGVRFK
ncbi:hypothetical protein CLG96_13445 [Sphingomonas oleivorans]|uniref:Outer membrane protein beta-barrel domain-containing protein n=1 Tax=Sphingomonas oleivorans TaxID=1735121 RepID=A0A2T5FWH2_9SPHN|nr:porin family protein [Sphingomonas oleivorans]PTQ10128.1 hypothetical protein CLG96_13445 [Sphingomonas oleivorans]